MLLPQSSASSCRQQQKQHRPKQQERHPRCNYTDAIDCPPYKKTKINADDTCVYCNSSPCILDQGLYDLLSEGGLLHDDGQDDMKYIQKQIRYDMYRKASQFIYGPLGKGNRKQLPQCLVSEIHDFAPKDA